MTDPARNAANDAAPTSPITILITGGARRLGRAMALRFAAPGRTIVIHHHASHDEAETTARDCRERGAEAHLEQGDLTSASGAAELVDRVAAAHGLDVLVNNASVFYPTPLPDATPDAWDDLFAINARAPFFAAQAAVRNLRERGGGVILNMCDTAPERPAARYIPYMASKAALIATTRGLARALAPDIRVVGIAPGPVLRPEDYDDAKAEKAAARTLLKRFGSPDDIAAAAEYLVFGAPYVTGAILPVDGGRDLI